MAENFRIYPSRALFGLSLAAHALIALAIAVFVDSTLLKYCGLLLVLLLASRDSACWLRRRSFRLDLDSRRQMITLIRDGQPYFHGKYKVYANRWFAILKLVNKQKSRTLILFPDRFHSIQCYRSLRYRLRQREHFDAA